MPGHATAVTESTRFAGPALALLPRRVTRHRRRRGGWPWPEGYFRPSLARRRRTGSGRHGRKRWPGRTRARRELAMRTGSGARLRIRRPVRMLRPNRPPACSLAAFEPSLHFVDLVHALNDDAAGLGGTSSSRAPRRTLMSMQRLMALSTVCGSMSLSCELRSSLSVLSRRSDARSGSRAQSARAPIGPRPTLDARARLTGVGQGGERAGRVRIDGDEQGRRRSALSRCSSSAPSVLTECLAAELQHRRSTTHRKGTVRRIRGSARREAYHDGQGGRQGAGGTPRLPGKGSAWREAGRGATCRAGRGAVPVVFWKRTTRGAAGAERLAGQMLRETRRGRRMRRQGNTRRRAMPHHGAGSGHLTGTGSPIRTRHTPDPLPAAVSRPRGAAPPSRSSSECTAAAVRPGSI